MNRMTNQVFLREVTEDGLPIFFAQQDDPEAKLARRILKYGLTDPALLRLAKIVHAADIASELHSDPLAPGLEAIATGYGLRFPDDAENLERQFDVYDALYAWCRLQVAGEQ